MTSRPFSADRDRTPLKWENGPGMDTFGPRQCKRLK